MGRIRTVGDVTRPVRALRAGFGSAALGPAGVERLPAASMEEAVALAARLARPGDAVLLSPACASFDMFRDYAHRAQVFCDAVHAIAADSAQPSGATA